MRDDYVLLTPADMLTRDDTWINYGDMISKFSQLPEAIPNAELRANINQYFKRILGQDPTAKQRREAAAATINRFPELIDRYIKLQEDDGDRARSVSANKVEDTYRVLVEQIRKAIADVAERTELYDKPWRSYDECLARARYFKQYIENNDGYLLFNRAGKPFSNEKELHLAFGLVWCGTDFDINREVNNGRGPVDFKASFGAGDKSPIEFKLASNTALKRNLEKQVEIDFDDLMGERRYSGQRAYSQSKLATVMFTYELAPRLEGTGVTATVLHPGVTRTAFGAEDSTRGMAPIIAALRPFMRSPERGADTAV